MAGCEFCQETICVEYETQKILEPQTMVTLEFQTCVKTIPNPDYESCINKHD